MTDGVRVLDAETFDSTIEHGLWLVDFWAAWCAPCHALDPVLADVAAMQDEAGIAKVEITEQPQLGDRYEIASLPTMIIFRDGAPVRRLAGHRNQRQLLVALEDSRASQSG